MDMNISDKFLSEVFQMQRQLFRYVGPLDPVYEQANVDDLLHERKLQAQEHLLMSRRARVQLLAPPLLPMPLAECEDDDDVGYKILPPYIRPNELVPVLTVPTFIEPDQPIGITTNSNLKQNYPRLVKSNQLIRIYDRETMFDSNNINNTLPHPDISLQFDANFENGNLEKVDKVSLSEGSNIEEYYITLTTDPQINNNTDNNNNHIEHSQWFHFRIKNIKPNMIYKFKIINLTQSM